MEQIFEKYLKKQQVKWSAFESTTERIPWDQPEFPAEEAKAQVNDMPVPPPEPVKERLDQHLENEPSPAPEAPETAPTVLVGDGIVVDESGSYWYSYRHRRSPRNSYEEARVMVKGRKVSVQGTWSDETVALDLSAMETLRIESQPAMLRHVDRGVWIMWLVLSHRADRQVCTNETEKVAADWEEKAGERMRAFAIAESEFPEGPFKLRSQLFFDERLISLRCCRDLMPIFAYLVSSSRKSEKQGEGESDSDGKPLVILLDDDLVGIKTAWSLPGTSGNPISMARSGDLWYLLTTTSRPDRNALSLIDLIRHNDVWTSPALGAGQVWNHSGQPISRKMNPENSSLSLAINILVNTRVGCMQFLFANGHTYLRCGSAEDLLPGARLM
ncbi:hypothetical protein GUITHDRAFT_108120 [Guillardia theta CCMP2712]|uniref:Uncharacterized protein n=1 Tax=Guillardia theta (strain CCMP2712) TaxID=905079 RepID=L1JD89_GUITC|nr:hypothetical protein GUITHDRAFT_108120 [Guillardia theta CCMP2712]EKX46084.1 hypothetical protein GUITHDRAFT_108120 [Guillardia theta CCMP2712]|eukprot:XP_005833064.1 hypothetical protein GUITHDRAFT_108120 [Guillardia theta CCMP2712]